jgi:hypothetical protein
LLALNALIALNALTRQANARRQNRERKNAARGMTCTTQRRSGTWLGIAGKKVADRACPILESGILGFDLAWGAAKE